MGSTPITLTQADTTRIITLNDHRESGAFLTPPLGRRPGRPGEDTTALTSIRRTHPRPPRFEKSRRKRARFLTTLAIFGLCSVAVVRGWSIVRFVDLRAHLGSRETPVASLRSWVGVPGIGSAALQASLTQMADL